MTVREKAVFDAHVAAVMAVDLECKRLEMIHVECPLDPDTVHQVRLALTLGKALRAA